MREIKFKAIYKPTGEHIKPISINFNDNTLTFFNPETGDNDWCYFSNDGSSGDAILRQYTGLKDKNGREIYEGDILYWDDNISGVIKYKDGSFYFETVDEFYSSWLRVIKHDLETRMEVIGNIYENPELLGGSNG